MDPLTVISFVFPHTHQIILIFLESLSLRRGSWDNNLIWLFWSFRDFTAGDMECPCKKDPLNHSIYHNMVKENIKWMYILIIIRLFQHAFHMQHISHFSWGVPLVMWRRERTIPLLGINELYSVFSPVHQASCPFRKKPVVCLDNVQ